jgi:hypothetical protein
MAAEGAVARAGEDQLATPAEDLERRQVRQ